MTIADFHTRKWKWGANSRLLTTSLTSLTAAFAASNPKTQVSMSKTFLKTNPRNSKGPSDIWWNATTQPTSLSSHWMAAKVYIDKLNLTTDQKSELQDIYTSKNIQNFTYLPHDESQQISATALLATHQLYFDAWENLVSKWSIKWRVNSGAGKKADCRVLYQWYALSI